MSDTESTTNQDQAPDGDSAPGETDVDVSAEEAASVDVRSADAPGADAMPAKAEPTDADTADSEPADEPPRGAEAEDADSGRADEPPGEAEPIDASHVGETSADEPPDEAEPTDASPVDEPPAEKRSLPYMPGLDGLRAIAVVAVLLYHADLMWIPGGFLGVEVFFVISGFLITSLLLREHDRTGTIGLRRFWGRRARRLLPALFALLLASAVYVALFLPEEVSRLRGDFAAAFTYITNWYLILKQESYFESMGRPSILKHLWSLAVEEQFYIFWPMLFAGGLLLLRRRGFLVATILAALGSTALMWLLYEPNTDPSRVYYGTDTRAAGLLIGAALAFVWQPWRVHELRLSKSKRFAVDLAGLAGLVAVVVMFLRLSEYGDFLFQGGFLVLAVATAALIAATVLPDGWLGRALGVYPMRWIGLRSYSIYLWHWPVFMVTRPGMDVALYGWPLLALRLVATFVLADLSYRLVEQPFRRRDLDRWMAAARRRLPRSPSGPAVEWALVVATPAAVLIALAWGQVSTIPEWQALLSMDADVSAADIDDGLVGASSASPDSDSGAVLLNEGAAAERADDGSEPGMAGDSSRDEPEVVGEKARGASNGTAEATGAERRSGTDAAAAVGGTAVAAGAAEADGRAVSPGFATSAAARMRDSGPGTAPPPRFATPDRVAMLRATRQSAVGGWPADPESLRDGVWDAAEPPADRTAAALDALLRSPPEARIAATQMALRRNINPDIGQVTFLGDSVMLSAEFALTDVFGPSARIDATVSRQFYSAIDTVHFLRHTGQLNDAIVIHLGNNGAINDQQFDDMMAALSDVEHVYFVTVKVPRRWEGVVNEAIAEGVERHPRVTVIDWHSISGRRPELFREDGVHLVPSGAEFYAELIASSL